MSWQIPDGKGGYEAYGWNEELPPEVLTSLSQELDGINREKALIESATGELISERIPVIPYSEEETNAKKWGLLNSVVDAIKAGGSKLGDFLYGDTDFGYMEGTEEQRRRAADEQRRRESAERAIRERDQSREWRQIDMMDSGPKGPRRAGYGLDMFGNPISRY